MAKIRRLVLLGPALVLLGMGPAVHAASFSCDKAATPLERAVCADAELSKLDEELAAAYQAVRKQLSAAGTAEVQADQHKWLSFLRARCRAGDKDFALCLDDEYTQRRDGLRQGTVQLGGVLFFARLKVLIVPDKTPLEERSTGDPGFGVGHFSWPEIDHPTPEQAKWNAAVRAQVVALSSGRNKTDFDPEDAAGGDLEVTYTVQAASDALISVWLMSQMFGYGAAHPSEDYRYFNWLPPKQRPLRMQDIFRPGSGWQALVVQRSLKKAAEILGEDDTEDLQRSEAVRAVRDSGNWAPQAQQLTIYFPEYALIPRAYGDLSVSFSWKELKPYLAEGFDPATLPVWRYKQ